MATNNLGTIAFLGCGTMGEAILGNMLKNGTDPVIPIATVQSGSRAKGLRSRRGVSVLATQLQPNANRHSVQDADVVILGVKPLDIPELARSIADALPPQAVVVSIAAGVTIEQLQSALPAQQAIVRAIPNIGVNVGRGVVGLSKNVHCSEEQFNSAREVFFGAGLVIEIPETQQNALMSVGGSGLAYVFYFAETLSAAARSHGLDSELAQTLSRQLLIGAGELLKKTWKTPEELRGMVTSPKGTTERALSEYENGGLDVLSRNATNAAIARSEELSKKVSEQALS